MKTKICGIYKITSPTNKLYIGQSRDIYARFKIYEKGDCLNQRKLRLSLEKHGYENHKFEILEECSIEMLNEREIHYIKLYDTFNTPHGMNLTSGGSNPKISDETRKLLSLASKGKPKPLSPEHVAENTKRLLEQNKKRIGTKLTEDHKRKISSGNMGKKLSKEHREHLSKIKTGFRHSEKTLKKMSDIKIGKKVNYSPEQKKLNADRLRELSGNRKGKNISEEHKEKLRKANIGKKMSEESKLKMKARRKNVIITEEWKKNMSKSHQGKKQSPESIQKSVETKKKYKLIREQNLVSISLPITSFTIGNKIYII